MVLFFVELKKRIEKYNEQLSFFLDICWSEVAKDLCLSCFIAVPDVASFWGKASKKMLVAVFNFCNILLDNVCLQEGGVLCIFLLCIKRFITWTCLFFEQYETLYDVSLLLTSFVKSYQTFYTMGWSRFV